MGSYVVAHALSAVGIFAVTLLIDLTLVSQGARLAAWGEAGASAAFGSILLAPLTLVMWRLGIVRLAQYLLAALVLFPPATLLTAMFYPLIGLSIMPPEGYPWVDESRLLAFEMSVRLVRASVATPIYLFTFWAIYHNRLGRGVV